MEGDRKGRKASSGSFELGSEQARGGELEGRRCP